MASSFANAADIRQQIHMGVLKLCKQAFGDSISLEIDAILAITFPVSQQEMVVKVHHKLPINGKFSGICDNNIIK